MSATDINAVLVRDSRLNIKDKIDFAVEKGAMTQNIQPYEALSKSASNVVFNIQTPSLNTLIDRRVMWHGKFVLKFTGSVQNTNKPFLRIGKYDSLGPMPMHSMCTTMQATINNNTFAINQKDVNALLLRFIDRREALKLNGAAPSLPDSYFGVYNDGSDSVSNTLSGLNNADHSSTYLPRGSYRVLGSSSNIGTLQEGVFATMPGVLPAPLPVNVTQFYVLCESWEPLMMSPFLFNSPAHQPALLGIQTMNFQFNLDPVANRAWRHANYTPDVTISSVSLERWDTCELTFKYFSAHPSLELPPQNVIYYNDISRYIQPVSKSVSPATRETQQNIKPTTFEASTGTLTLNSIPDKMIFAVRKKMSSQTNSEPDRWFPITNCNITWDTRAGLMSTLRKDDLYDISLKNGANLSFIEFSGVGNLDNGSSTGYGYNVATCGGFLVVSPTYDMTLNEDFYSCGSIGQFQIQVKLQCENYYTGADGTFNAGDLELIFITMDSGIMVNQAGSTQKYIGILNKEVVLNTSKSQEPYYNEDVERLIGGASVFDKVKGAVGSMLSKLRPALTSVRQVAEKVDDPRAKMGAEVLKKLGYGKKGGRLSEFIE